MDFVNKTLYLHFLYISLVSHQNLLFTVYFTQINFEMISTHQLSKITPIFIWLYGNFQLIKKMGCRHKFYNNPYIHIKLINKSFHYPSIYAIKAAHVIHITLYINFRWQKSRCASIQLLKLYLASSKYKFLLDHPLSINFTLASFIPLFLSLQ